MRGLRGQSSGVAMIFSTTTGNDDFSPLKRTFALTTDRQLELFESGHEAKSEPEAGEEKYKSTRGSFFNGRIWTVPEDVPF